jgi:transposase
MKIQKFTIKQFNQKYPNDDACLHEIFINRYETLTNCPSCKKKTKFYKVSNRKCYACQFCGYQIHPLANTIFHKSDTSLKNWFFAIYLFANSKNGVSAKELERQLGVTYKCAWRMAKQIRILFTQVGAILENIVEADETYIGGKSQGKRGRGAEGKTPVFGLVQRKGKVVAHVVNNTKSSTIIPIVQNNVQTGSTMMTDEFGTYNPIRKAGYEHQRVNHTIKQYAVGDVHVNTIEGFWSQFKRSVNGTYHAVSPKYLQSYVNEFSYRYSHRKSLTPLFLRLLSTVGKPV